MFRMSSISVAAAGLSALAIVGCETIFQAVTGSHRPDTAAAAPAGLMPGSSGAASDPATIAACAGVDDCLSVLSFNMKHRDVPIQLEAVAKGFKADLARLPDFILCQEVVFGRPKKRGYENTAAALANLLAYHFRGTARRSGLEGVAILSRHPFEHYDCLHLKARDSFFSGGSPRVSVMGEFVVPEIGRVRVVNVHLAYRESVQDVRRAQLRETLDWMSDRQRAAPADVIVLGGDFNIEPEWAELALIHDSAPPGAGDLAFKDYNSRVPTSGAIGNPYRRVDYVFVASPDRTVQSVGEAVLWQNGLPTSDGSSRFWASDHLPLLHVFAIEPVGPGS